MLLVRHDAVAFPLAIVVTIVLYPSDGQRTLVGQSCFQSHDQPSSADVVYRAAVRDPAFQLQACVRTETPANPPCLLGRGFSIVTARPLTRPTCQRPCSTRTPTLSTVLVGVRPCVP
jgi:hypothetical protein